MERTDTNKSRKKKNNKINLVAGLNLWNDRNNKVIKRIKKKKMYDNKRIVKNCKIK